MGKIAPTNDLFVTLCMLVYIVGIHMDEIELSPAAQTLNKATKAYVYFPSSCADQTRRKFAAVVGMAKSPQDAPRLTSIPERQNLYNVHSINDLISYLWNVYHGISSGPQR